MVANALSGYLDAELPTGDGDCKRAEVTYIEENSFVSTHRMFGFKVS
jgi:hypothetical protein